MCVHSGTSIVLRRALAYSDGKQDLAISNANGVGIMLGNGDGSFQLQPTLLKGRTDFLVAGDFNGDGNPDLAAVGTIPSGAEVSIYLGNGDGTLQPAKNGWIRDHVSPGGAATADFNGDGNLDLAVTLGGAFAILLGDGDGGFQPPSFHPGTGWMPMAVDVDGNGTPDLIFLTPAGIEITLNER